MDTNITLIKTIPSPNELIKKYVLNVEDELFVKESRINIQNILTNKDDRLIVIIGPCSIHDYNLALEYAKHVKVFQEQNPNLFIVMRVYFEKPRSRHGWKGFIYDPDLNETYDINKGLNLARKLLLEITKLRIPIGCEFLDTISPQYLSDLVSWGAIGARTSESQIHRQLASGLSMPVGFKNLTEGDYKKAIDGILSAKYSHQFLGIDYEGKACHISTNGNQYSHLILRGGLLPNYYQKDVEEISKELEKEKINTGIIIDCSHGNSQKEYVKQVLVACSITRLIGLKKYNIKGVMIESNINSGNQKLVSSSSALIGQAVVYPLKRGVSITDGCINIESSNIVLKVLNSNKNIVDLYTIDEVRNYLNKYETIIDNLYENKEVEDDMLLENNMVNNILINYDDELYDIVKDNIKLMCYIHKRLSSSEVIGYIKYMKEPFKFLNKANDFYKLITDREREYNILTKVRQYNIFIKMIELSKRIQTRYLEEYVKTKTIGYLGNKGSFSSEVINNFYGTHIGCNSIKDIFVRLSSKEIEYGLLPTYNSLIGKLYDIPDKFYCIGCADHTIRLGLFGNKCKKGKKIYLQEMVYKEAIEYIEKKLGNIEVEICDNTEEAFLKCVKNENTMTIASVNNKCNLIDLIEMDIIDHNITTFSLIKNQQ